MQQSFYPKIRTTNKLFKNCFAVFYRPGQQYEFSNDSGMIKGLRYNKNDKKNFRRVTSV